MFITIFSIVASACSIASFIYIYFSKYEKKRIKRFNKIVLPIVGVVAVLLSLYVLLVPGNLLQQNVESKISYFTSNDEKIDNEILIQEGEFTYTGIGEQSIQFYIPYKDTPVVEIINEKAINGAPGISEITEHQFKVYRNYTGGYQEKYKWIARGIPLDEITESS